MLSFINYACPEKGVYINLHMGNQHVNNTMTSHRVALGPTHHLPVVEPLRSKDLVESPKRKLPLLEDAREPSSCKATQAPLESQLMLLLRPELPPAEGTYHRVPAAPPLLGMT